MSRFRALTGTKRAGAARRKNAVDVTVLNRIGKNDCASGAEAARGVFKTETAKGFVLRQAAPLVLSAACRKEGLSVRFTARPATDGKTVWLGPIDFGNPLAPVFVYGHGLHERGHVVHSDFSLLRGAAVKNAPACVFEWANLFEDVRVDALTSAAYAGYGILREALYLALQRAGMSRFVADVPGRPAYDVVKLYYLARLWERELGLTVVERDLQWLEREMGRIFTEDEKLRLDRLVFSAWPLSSTGDAVSLALRLAELLGNFAETLAPPQKGADEGKATSDGKGDSLSPEPFQPSLFGEAWGYEEKRDESDAVRRDRILSILEGSGRPAFAGSGHAKADASTGLARKGENRVTYEDGPAFRAESWMRMDRLERALWPADTRIVPAGGETAPARRRPDVEMLFKKTLSRLTRLNGALEDLLLRRVPLPVGLTETGWDVDDMELDRLAVGDARVFSVWEDAQGVEAAVSILLDSSGSLSEEDFALVKASGYRLASVLEKVPNVALETALFPGDAGYTAEVITTFGESVEAFAKRTGARESCGGTPVVAALLSTAQRLLERPEARKILILLTDGHFERENLRSVPEDVEAAGIELGVLLVGSNAADLWGRHCERIRDVRGVPAGIVKLMKRLLQAARN